MKPVMLKIDSLKVVYDGIQAVEGVGLEIREGELVMLIGANGASKTATMRAITGLQGWAGGDVQYLGESIKDVPNYNLLKQGLVMVPEDRGVFVCTTIAEDLRMDVFTRNDEANIKAGIDRMLGISPRLKERANQLTGTMSDGKQQMLAMACVLTSQLKLLLLNEPSVGLSSVMVEEVFKVVHDISAQGVTALLVEQNACLALQAAHRSYVMDSDLVTMSGDAKQMLDDLGVRVTYLDE